MFNNTFSALPPVCTGAVVLAAPMAAAADTEIIETVHLSAFYKPVSNGIVGLKYLAGEGVLFARDSAEADHIRAAALFNS